MPWWKKFWTQFGFGPRRDVEFPYEKELIPNQLSAQITLTEIRTMVETFSCWTFVSHGFFRHRHKELILNLRILRRHVSQFPEEVFAFFQTIYLYARQGVRVDHGNITEFGENFLGYQGAIYLSGEWCPLDEINQSHLVVLFLRGEEMEALKKFGPTRLMIQLARETKYYPCPVWVDMNRKGPPLKKVIKDSILNKLLCIMINQVWTYKQDNQIHCRLTNASAEKLLEAIDRFPDNVAITVLTALYPESDGCMVWHPDLPAPAAVAPPKSDGNCLSGCFLTLAANRGARGGRDDYWDNMSRMMEDGFGVFLTHESWGWFIEALQDHRPLTLRAPQRGMDFVLEWEDEEE